MGLVNVSHLIFSVFVKKWLIYTRHGSKQTSKLPQLQNLSWSLPKITFFAIYCLSRGTLRTLIINGSE